MSLSKKIGTVVVLVSLVSAFAAENFTEKDFFDSHRDYANRNDAASQFNVGWGYDFGKGTNKNAGQALSWYMKAANKGNEVAQFYVAFDYEKKRNYKQAIAWYQKAAAKNHEGAFYKLGECYEFGRGVKQSWPEAVKWYRKSAEARNADAQYILAECYAKGQGIAANKDWAIYWYRRAAANGVVKAQEALKAYGLD